MKLDKRLILAMALMPMVAPAQFDFGGGSREPAKEAWEEFKINTKTKVKLDFRNASVDSIISYFSKTSGITIIKDPALTGSLSLTSPNAISLSDAFSMLKTTLDLKNFELKKEGKALVIRQRRQDNRGGMGGMGGGNSAFGGMSMEQMSQMFGGNSRNELKVYPLKNANASQAARVVNEVFAGAQSPFDQFMQQMGGGGGFNMGGGNQFGGGGGRQGGGGNNPFAGGGGRNQGGGFGRGGFGRGGFGGSTQTVRASSDDYSNSVIVNAPSSEQRQVETLLKQIDKETEQPLKPVVYRLEYAAASDVSVAVQNVLTTNAPRGRGGAGQSNVPIEQRFQQAFRFGNTQAAFGTVVADTRTNSLVVTATEDNHELITSVLKELDRPVELASSTFVVPLNNARADLVAQLLNQTFGTRTGTGTGNRNTGTVGRSPQTQNRLNQGNQGGGGGTGRSREYVPSDDEMSAGAMDLEGQINPETGEFMPVVAVQQGGGFNFFQQGGGGQNRQNQTRQATGRDAQGRLINVNDLTNQITVIPDQNTNSLIIVSSPDQVELIKKILDQLDRIPEQVMIETVIVEATLDASSKLGIEWNYSQSRPFGTPGTNGTAAGAFGLQNANPALQGFRYTLTGGALTGFMNALATDKKFQVLSTPRIFTSNNSQAQINISQRVPYVLSSRTDANNNLTFTYAFEDVGIILTVTPRITSNGYVTMEVNQTANDLQGFTDFNAPIINQREADTTVSVKDGETIILGGIIRNSITSTVKKIPLLGDIPLLGELFKSTDKSKVKTELLVFLTPRVVRNEQEARELKQDEVNRLSKPTQKSLEDAKKSKTGNKVEVKDMKEIKKEGDNKTGTGGEKQTKPN